MKKLVLLLIAISANTFAGKPFELLSPSFHAGDRIPVLYTCEGSNVSPQLVWLGPPEEVKSYALLVTDPDAITSEGIVFDHWLAYDIPASSTGLPVGVRGLKEGLNSLNNPEYQGPCPPSGEVHHYIFTLYALDKSSLGLPSGATMLEITKAMQGHIIDQTSTTGTFGR